MKRIAPLLLATALLASPAFAAGGEKKQSGSESFMPMVGLSSGVSTAFTFAGILTVDAGLDIPDPKVRSRAEGLQPRLRDAMRAELSEYSANLYRAGHIPDADLIKRRLQRGVDRVMGEGEAEVLLMAVIAHRPR